MIFLARFICSRSAATSIEYGMIAAIISIALVAGATLIGDRLSNVFFGPLTNGLP